MSDLRYWLTELGLKKYLAAFSEAEIDFETLSDLTEEDLKELGLPLGPRRKIWGAIRRLDDADASPAEAPTSHSSTEAVRSAAPSVPDAERRHLTVMFVDLVGSTEMATKIDPEDMRNVITNYQNTIAGMVTRYEGFVAKFMGDGVLCYFGWPRANEDDAERAVRAGLAMISAIAQQSGPGGVPLSTRVGIATGVVIVGDLIGSGATQEAAVVGETPNLAARLQGLAQPNQLVLPKETQSLLGDIFLLEPMGARSLKGIAEPVDAFVVIGENTRESRFAARRLGTLTPIVGREQELGLMRECWTKAKSAAGQMILVSGEAGIGKSRIAKAAIDEMAKDAPIRLTYQCSPYHADSAFYPIIQQMSFAAGFQASDDVEARLDKLEGLIGADRDSAALFAMLLGIDASRRYGVLDLTPAQIRARTMQALVDLLIRQAETTPVLAVFEDLHWVDPTTLELLDLALDAIADRTILVLATARPTFQHGFGGHPIVTRFALNRLGKAQILSIISKLTGGKNLPQEVLQIIVSRTDGVPLFVEELTKTILETEMLKDDGDRLVLTGPLNALAIPGTLHDSLMARLDRLQPIKEIAQTAACIGREFDHRLLAKISELSQEDLGTALEGLIKAELIYRRGLPPEATYLFKHALVRDAAYESLLRQRRRSIHAKIVTALETEPDFAHEVLAVHAEAAGLTDRAIDLWEAASKAAIARPAFDEGLSHLKRAIALIAPQLDSGDEAPLDHALSLQVQLSVASLTRMGYGADETIAAFEHALVLADRIGETPMRYPILYGLWIGQGIRSEHAVALQRADALLEQAAKSTETAPLVVANRVAGTSRCFMGDVIGAGRYLDVALAQYDPIAHAGLANRFGQDIGVTLHIFLAINCIALGQSRRARTHATQAERMAKATGHVQTICFMQMCSCMFALAARNTAIVDRMVAEIEPIAREHNLTVWLGFLSMMRELPVARNGVEAGIRQFMAADAAMIATKSTLFVSQMRVEAARCALTLGLRAEALELARLAGDMIGATGENYALSDLHRLQGALALDRDDPAGAEQCLKQAIDVSNRQGSLLWEVRAAIDLARLWRDQGRIDESMSLLQPVYDRIRQGDCPDERAGAQTLLTAIAG